MAIRQGQLGHGPFAQQRSDGYRAGRFDDDFHALPDQARGGDDFCFAHEQNSGNAFAQNGEGAGGEGRAQAIRDGVAGLEGLQRAGGQRAVGIVGALGLATKHAYFRAQALRAEAGAAQESTAADGREHGVQIADLFEQFFGGGGLPRDDAVVVVRMHQHGAGFRLHARGSFGARGNRGLAKGDLPAVSLAAAQATAAP